MAAIIRLGIGGSVRVGGCLLMLLLSPFLMVERARSSSASVEIVSPVSGSFFIGGTFQFNVVFRSSEPCSAMITIATNGQYGRTIRYAHIHTFDGSFSLGQAMTADNTLWELDIDVTDTATHKSLAHVSCPVIHNPPLSLKSGHTALCAGSPDLLTITDYQGFTKSGFTMQWRKDGQPISGATSSSYAVQGNAEEAGQYDVVLTNSNGTYLSQPLALAFSLPLSIVEQPHDTMVCAGMPVILTVRATGDHLRYAWYWKGRLIPGANGASYEITDVQGRNYYHVVVDGPCGSVTSQPAWVTQHYANIALGYSQGGRVDRVEGESVALRPLILILMGGFPIQWRKDGVLIPGATHDTLTIDAVKPSDAGYYDMVVYDTCGPLASVNGWHLVVRSAPSGVDDHVAEVVPGIPEMTVTPNPTRSLTTLDLRGAERMCRDGARLVLTAADGREVLDLSETFHGQGCTRAEFDAGSIPSGTYLCTLRAGGRCVPLGAVVVVH